MEERITKLLILAGDEAAQHQKRDFGKIVAIIVDQYLVKNQQNTEKVIDLFTLNIILQKLTQVINKIPLKQHLYAGLTAKISLKNKDFANHIIQTTINNLQIALGQFQFYQSINILTYLSQLMNIMLLNSLTFMNVLQDVLDKIQASNQSNVKKFYFTVLVRILPVCIWSLSEKLFSELKKFMDLLENHIQNDSLFGYLKGMVNKGKIINFSLMGRLEDKFEGIPQFNFKRKLKIQINTQKASLWAPVEYYNLNRQIEDELYKQFYQEEGRIHQFIIQQIVQTFYPRSSILNMKMINYINSIPSHKEVYMYQLTISTLIAKCLKSSRPIVEQSLLINIINSFNQKTSQQNGNLTKSELSNMLQNQVYELFSKGQNVDFGTILNLSNMISFWANNLKQDWDWQRYLQNQNAFVKRRVLLSLILEKTKVLNDNLVLPQAYNQFPHYQIPQKLTNQMEYQTTEDMELFQSFQQALKAKSNAQKVNQMITNDHLYEIFLEALFRRTSLSHTHLKTLIQRYKQVLIANKEHDWTLINKIRNFWKKSYLNRQLYIQMMMKSEFITFNSYANYINQLKDKNEREMIWIKIELNQLHNLFGNAKKNK